MSKPPIKLQESRSTISAAKLNEYLSIFLIVNGPKIGATTFASLYESVREADKIDLKDGQPSTHFLCTLQEPCNYPMSSYH